MKEIWRFEGLAQILFCEKVNESPCLTKFKNIIWTVASERNVPNLNEGYFKNTNLGKENSFWPRFWSIRLIFWLLFEDRMTSNLTCMLLKEWLGKTDAATK